MSSRGEVSARSVLHAAPPAVWERITTFEGVNDEFRPWLRMTAPRAVREAGISGAVTGERLCRSWILLFGVIPVDYDDITLVALEPGRGFHERSTMLSQRVWEHERTLEAHPEGCVVTDRVGFVPRLPISPRLLRPLFGAVFRHRHRRLRRRFGGRSLGSE